MGTEISKERLDALEAWLVEFGNKWENNSTQEHTQETDFMQNEVFELMDAYKEEHKELGDMRAALRAVDVYLAAPYVMPGEPEAIAQLVKQALKGDQSNG